MTAADEVGLRAALLDAAREELDQGGSAAVSLRAVARRAGVSHAAPAYAFGDRAGLLTAVAVSGFTQLARIMDVPAAPGRAGLAELGRRYLEFAAANPALYEVMFRPADLVQEDQALQAARAASLRALAGLNRDDAAAPPDQAALVSWAFVHGLASLAAQGALPTPMAADLIDHFAALVLF